MSEMMPEHIKSLFMEVAAAKRKLRDALKQSEPQRVKDYAFDRVTATQTTPQRTSLSRLFGEKRDLLVVHNMGKGCRYCTLWADGLVSLYPHLVNRTAIAVSSPDDSATQAAFAAERKWPFNMVSIKGSDFARDLGFQMPDGGYYPGVSAFHKDDAGNIARVNAAPFGPGDDFCAVWPLFDLLKGGPGEWEPQYSY